MEALIRYDHEQRERLSVALHQAAAARADVAAAQETVRAREAALAQRRLDIVHRDKATLAANLLSPFEFSTCPRCLQTLAGRAMRPGECLLCRQPEPQVLDDDEQHARLVRQTVETEALLDAEISAQIRAERASSAAERAADEAQRRYDESTYQVVAPRTQAVVESSQEVEALCQGLHDIDQRMAMWRTLGEYEDESVRLRASKRDLDGDIKRLEQQLASREERLAGFSALFAEEVRLIGVNLNGTPTIDPVTYLPRIGDSEVDALQASGGGSTTAINVAFSLALLNYAVRNTDVVLPNLLILDSPRKGIGRTEREDQELVQRIYERLKILAQALAGRGQLIVADNEAELGDEKDVSLIKLTIKESAVPGVPNTGVGTQTKVEDLDEYEV